MKRTIHVQDAPKLPQRREFLTHAACFAAAAMAPGNADFDRDLRARDAAWGLRDLDAVAALARDHGFSPPDVVEMPANNLSLIFNATS